MTTDEITHDSGLVNHDDRRELIEKGINPSRNLRDIIDDYERRINRLERELSRLRSFVGAPEA